MNEGEAERQQNAEVLIYKYGYKKDEPQVAVAAFDLVKFYSLWRCGVRAAANNYFQSHTHM